MYNLRVRSATITMHTLCRALDLQCGVNQGNSRLQTQADRFQPICCDLYFVRSCWTLQVRLGWGKCLLELRAILIKGRSRALSQWLSLNSRLWHSSARAGTVLVLEGLRHQSTSEVLLKRIHGLHDPTSPQKPTLLEMQLALLGWVPPCVLRL